MTFRGLLVFYDPPKAEHNAQSVTSTGSAFASR